MFRGPRCLDFVLLDPDHPGSPPFWNKVHADSNYSKHSGIKARRVLKTLPTIPVNITERTVEGILTALETNCVPRKNTTYERYFCRITIQEDRSFDIFVTDLRRKAEYSDFGAIKDSLIRDQIVVGINDSKLRERLLRETDLTLEKAIKLCRITEQSQEQLKIFISPTTQTGNIDAVKKKEPPVDTTKSKNENSPRIMKCKFCVASYNRGNCAAYGTTCHNCNGRNHYARCCFKSKNGTEERRVCHVEVEENENIHTYFITTSPKRIFRGNTVKVKIIIQLS